MNSRQTVLIVEDEPSVCKFISTLLKTSGYNVLTADCGKDALAMVGSFVPDLILLDLGLPDIEGLEVIKRVRKTSNIPILVVSARESEKDKITALDLGADDYITKPFSGGELLARIRTSLRHKRLSIDEQFRNVQRYVHGNLKIDFERYRVQVDGNDVHLTNNEFKIIQLLAKYSGKVLTYDYILKEIWGPHAGEDNRTLRVNMANLRRKIEKNPAAPEYLFTEPGVGYRMAESEQPEDK